MITLELAGNATTNVVSPMVDILLRRQLLKNNLILNFSNDEKLEVLTWKNTLLSQVKSYINNNLNPTKVNVVYQTKDSFTQPLRSRKF